MLVEAVRSLFGADNEIRRIGTRHGEKLYETLLTREETARSEDMGEFYRVSADNRDLNYGKYFHEGSEHVSAGWEYNSHNTRRLDLEETRQLVGSLPEVQESLALYLGAAPDA
jgi:UDP-glucose 4-epimerase